MNSKCNPVLALALLAAMASGSALAQGAGMQAPSGDTALPPTDAMPPAESAAPLSDEQVAAFAEAQSRVIEIREKWDERLAEADSENEVMEGKASANEEMEIAVKNTGLSVAEYNEIAIAAQRDGTLRERIRKELTRS